MTTEATETPQPPVMNVAEVYRILGSLERGQAEIKERLDRQDQRLDRQEERFDRQEDRNNQRFSEVNRRIDRLTYTILGVGTALTVGLILQSVLGS